MTQLRSWSCSCAAGCLLDYLPAIVSSKIPAGLLEEKREVKLEGNVAVLTTPWS